MSVAYCPKCRARIVWKQTEQGAFMPVDPEPTRKGNLIVTVRGRVRVVTRAHPAQLRYTSHFASCSKRLPPKGLAQ